MNLLTQVLQNLTLGLLPPVIWSFFASLGFAVLFNIHGKKMFFAALGGALSWFVYLLFDGCFATDIPQYFLSTVAISVYAELLARRHRVPVTVYLIVAFIPLVPGGGAYYTMDYALAGNVELFMQEGMHTLSIAAALAMGIVLVSSLTRLHWGAKKQRGSF